MGLAWHLLMAAVTTDNTAVIGADVTANAVCAAVKLQVDAL